MLTLVLAEHDSQEDSEEGGEEEGEEGGEKGQRESERGTPGGFQEMIHRALVILENDEEAGGVRTGGGGGVERGEGACVGGREEGVEASLEPVSGEQVERSVGACEGSSGAVDPQLQVGNLLLLLLAVLVQIYKC
jgi:hypothetical protein